jgi:hypothetical protein
LHVCQHLLQILQLQLVPITITITA